MEVVVIFNLHQLKPSTEIHNDVKHHLHPHHPSYHPRPEEQGDHTGGHQCPANGHYPQQQPLPPSGCLRHLDVVESFEFVKALKSLLLQRPALLAPRPYFRRCCGNFRDPVALDVEVDFGGETAENQFGLCLGKLVRVRDRHIVDSVQHPI